MKKINQFTHKFMIAGLASVIGVCSYSAVNATTYSLSGDFIMFNPGNIQIGTTDSTLTGSFNDSNLSSMQINSTQNFYDKPWTAKNLLVSKTAGNFSVETCPTPADGSTMISGGEVPCVAPLPLSGTVGANQWGVSMLFDWSTSINIDVINIWDVIYTSNGTITLTSTDVEPDGILGLGFIDGPFSSPGAEYSANFNLTLTPPFLISSSFSQGGTETTTLLNVGDITIDTGIAGATAYDWSLNTQAQILTAVGANPTNEQTLVFNPTGLSGSYKASVSVTNGSDVVRADIPITIIPLTLSTADTDCDGVNDITEGAGDSDGDGIPNFLDHSLYTLKQLQLNITCDRSASIIEVDNGKINIGTKAQQKGFDDIITAGNIVATMSPVLTINDMTVDNNIIDSCIGGCFDFKVSGLTVGQSTNVTIPLSEAIPSNAVYRKSNGTSWKGFKIDNNNYISSADAISTGPTVCPAPGSTSYKPGLSKGKFCIQLTMNDGGPNDTDASKNGTIVDPGGIATTRQVNPEDASAIDGVGGVLWVLFGLAGISGLRRQSK